MRSTLTLAFALLSLAFVGCDSAKKGNFVGRWINKETQVHKIILTGDKTNIVERTLELNSTGNGELVIRVNGKTENGAKGKWAIQGDIFFLDYEGDKTLYMRVIRITNERMVIRTPEGNERIYDRLQ
jgi:hypothetical protein